jgi:hypothetical protein
MINKSFGKIWVKIRPIFANFCQLAEVVYARSGVVCPVIARVCEAFGLSAEAVGAVDEFAPADNCQLVRGAGAAAAAVAGCGAVGAGAALELVGDG